jgi:hypothetical protein
VRAEHLDQALVVGAILLDALELVAARTERAAWGGLEARDRGGRLLAGVDQVLGERADDAVSPGVDLADALLVLARVSITPAALALITAVTPPDWA